MRLLLVDDHLLFRRGLVHLLEETRPGMTLEHCGSRQELESRLKDQRDTAFDLILLDLNMPGFFGLESLQFVRSEAPDTPVIVVSGEEHSGVGVACLQAGADGFLAKSASAATMTETLAPWLGQDPQSDVKTSHEPMHTVPAAALSAHRHRAKEHRLTDRQRSVLRLAIQGKTNKMIGRELGISDGTVKTHLANLMSTFSVNTRTQLVFELARQGIRLDEHP